MSARNKQIRDMTHARAVLELDRRGVDPDARTIPASLSSETEYQRWFGREVLLHEPDAIDLSRASGDAGLPLLWNHDTSTILGRIKGVRLVDGVLRGVLHFGRSAEATSKWQDVVDGVLTDMSVGYRIHKWEEPDSSDLVRVTRWQPLEASVVSVPADYTVGINRSEELTMSDGHQPTSNDGGSAVNQGSPSGDVRRDFRIAHDAGRKEAIKIERDRIRAIDAIFSETDETGSYLVPDSELFRAIRARAVDEGWDELTTRREVMKANPMDVARYMPDVSTTTDKDLGIGRQAAAGGRQQRTALGEARVGETELEKLVAISTDAIMARAGMLDDASRQREIDASGYRGRSLLRIGEELLRKSGRPTDGLDDKSVARALLTRAGPMTGSDFPSILANVANKSALRGWATAGATWSMWCNTGSLPDFKQATIAGLGAFPDLDQIPRSGAPYQHAAMDDVHETAQLATYGKLFGISREAIINDDLNEFTRVPQAMGLAAARKVNGIAYAVLTASSYTGQTMTADSTALFNSNHSNYVASGSGAAPSVATLNTALAAMRKQKAPLPSGDSSAAYLNIEPAYLLTVPDLEGTARALLSSTYDPAGTTSSVSKRDAPNIWKDRLQLVVDPVLTLASGWWLSAAKAAAVDTVTVFFLNGQQSPYIEEVDMGSADGVTYKVRIDAVARALDFRGLYFNYGA